MPKKNVIYEIKCTTCDSTYIGSTIRPLHIRIREHLTMNNSSVYQHFSVCKDGHNIVKILATDSDPINIRIKEAILIKEKKPNMNTKEELEIIASCL